MTQKQHKKILLRLMSLGKRADKLVKDTDHLEPIPRGDTVGYIKIPFGDMCRINKPMMTMMTEEQKKCYVCRYKLILTGIREYFFKTYETVSFHPKNWNERTKQDVDDFEKHIDFYEQTQMNIFQERAGKKSGKTP